MAVPESGCTDAASSGRSARRRSADQRRSLRAVDRALHAGELAHPGQLAAGVVARVALHRLHVARQQLLESQAPCAPCRRAGGMGATHLLAYARREHPIHACVDARVQRLALHRQPHQQRRVAQLRAPQLRGPARRLELARRRAARARARSRCRSLGSMLLGRPRGARARAARAGPAPLAVRAPRSSARALPLAGGGRRSSSASAARRYRPVPPTTIGRRPAASSVVDLGVRELGILADAEARVERQERHQAVLQLACSAAEATPVSVSSPAYTCSASAETATGPLPRARSRSASATAIAVLPTPVGPNRAITCDGAGTRSSRRGSRTGR